ncbi:MAG: GDP-fucose synthetase [Alphaproteobacteria bacterium 65-37]|jgi:GDP-L-fucose synthase|uniref:GDP-L-fucose synthase family protein n=1 Tax=Reyranella sp. TaxID=1929291 RepID=UPI000960F323|nr:GDP-L-fucose synthase [Reyranella sp.]OJU44934.1 MAG: GDP-fucose synthetase [Alphaproteobacteria bacterium 65-37]
MPSNPPYTLRNKRIWVAGHRGLVGSALVRRLQSEGCEVVVAPRESVDLRHPDQVERWMREAKPQAVFLAAARVGGIYANDTRPAEFIYDNLMIQSNIVEASRRVGVEKLMLLGSSCIYPRLAPQPIPESALLTGALEPTNQWYAVAKIAGIKLGQAYRKQYGCDFISVMPTNLYGPGDNFDLLQSHVVPALLVKAHQAKLAQAPAMEVWGTGAVRREFLFVDDAADGMVYFMQHYSDEGIVNLGCGSDVPIRDLVELICKVVGYKGGIRFDTSRPDGTPRKMIDTSFAASLGWRARTSLQAGLEETYRWYIDNVASEKRRAVA